MTDALIFLHVLAAFLLMATVVMQSAVALGAPTPARTITLGNLFWDVGGIGTLVFGVWLALREDQWDFFSFWIIAALVLWLIATGIGGKARTLVDENRDRFAQLHWARTLVVVLLLADMIFKPGV